MILNLEQGLQGQQLTIAWGNTLNEEDKTKLIKQLFNESGPSCALNEAGVLGKNSMWSSNQKYIIMHVHLPLLRKNIPSYYTALRISGLTGVSKIQQE